MSQDLRAVDGMRSGKSEREESMRESSSWFKKYRLPLTLAAVALCFYIAGILSVVMQGC